MRIINLCSECRSETVWPADLAVFAKRTAKNSENNSRRLAVIFVARRVAAQDFCQK
jgi:hypothetical protein